MKKDLKKISDIFDILSNEVRLCILINLCNTDEKNVGDLQSCANTSQSVISQQLSKLKALGIISSKKQGNEVFYSITDNKVIEIIRTLKIGELNE